MKTTRKTMWLCLVAIATVSCSKEGGIGGGGLTSDDLLLTESTVDGILKARYEYDGQNRLTTLHGYDDDGALQTTVTYTYNNKGLLTAAEITNVDLEIEYIETYTYGDSDRPTSSKTTFAPEDAGNVITTTFTYSANQTVELTAIPEGYTSETIYTYDNNGNLLSIAVSADGQQVSLIEYGDYDNKKAAGKNGNPYPWRFNSPNNYQSVKATTPYAASNYDRVHKYTYNGEDYPTKMEIYNREGNTLVETHTYSYKSAN